MILQVLTAGLVLAGAVATAASDDFYPTGMAPEEIAKFNEYESKVIRFLKERGNTIPLRQFPMEFSQENGARLINEVFGDDWSAIRSYADRALADLPKTAIDDELLSEPTSRIEVRQLIEQLSSQPEPKRHALEARLAATRFWDPKVVAQTAASMIAGQIGTSEDAARNALYANYVMSNLATARTNDAPVLVLFSGVWMYVVEFERSQRGLIIMTGVSAYSRH